jgi:hypothetical protein
LRILLDECVPMRVLTSEAFVGHQVDHVKRVGLEGMKNGDLHRHVVGVYGLLVSTDAHFKSRFDLRPTPSTGVVCVRVVPNIFQLIDPALVQLASAVDLNQLVGKLTVLWRNRWEIR